MNTVYLVRHGENLANIEHVLSHRLVDYPLTSRGELQARQTAQFFAGQPVQEIYTSPLKRARQTAEIIAEPLGLAVTVVEDFREVNVGELEKTSSPADWELHNEIIRGWIKGDHERRFPGGEDYHELLGRMRSGLKQVAGIKDERHILVVGHGGMFTFTMKDLCPSVAPVELLQNPMVNCAVSTLEVPGEGEGPMRLVKWADHGHLSDEAVEAAPFQIVVKSLKGG